MTDFILKLVLKVLIISIYFKNVFVFTNRFKYETENEQNKKQTNYLKINS